MRYQVFQRFILGFGCALFCAEAITGSYVWGQGTVTTPGISIDQTSRTQWEPPSAWQDESLPLHPVIENLCDSCCPDWSHYGIFDFMFLQRDNATSGTVITEERVGGQVVPLFTTRSMQAATAPGVRLFYGALGPDCMGWEVGYLGVYGMFGAVDRSSLPNSLIIPGMNVPGWLTADEVRPTYASSLNTVEANIFTYRCCRECSSDTFLWSHLGNKPVCHCSNWLVGLRWAGLEEQADLNVLCCRSSSDEFTSYSVQTSSQMLGPQVGFRGRRQWKNWAVEGWAKAMLAGTLLSSNADPIFSSLAPSPPNKPFRVPRRLIDTGVGFLGDLNYTVTRRLNDTWWLRLGYNMIWLSGVALAPDQWDFTNNPTTSGTTLVGGGGVFLHGANLGLESRW
jgi:hypothetical protein